MTIFRTQVYSAIDAERDYQDRKYGHYKQQSFPGFLAIIRAELAEAEAAWLKDKTGDRQTALEEVVQVGATVVACLEKYGIRGYPVSTDDLPPQVDEDDEQSND